MSTNYWPIHRSSIDQLSTIYRRSIGEVSAKCRWTKSCIGRDTSGTTIDRVLTEWRSTIDRLSTAISTECRPSVDRVSTECRPSVDRLSTECRPSIDRLSTAISTDIWVDITHSKQDPTFLEVPLFPGIFQWGEPKNHFPFSTQPKFPESLPKWKAPFLYRCSVASGNCPLEW